MAKSCELTMDMLDKAIHKKNSRHENFGLWNSIAGLIPEVSIEISDMIGDGKEKEESFITKLHEKEDEVCRKK